MFNKKAQMLRKIFIGVILFSMAFIALFNAYTDIINDYGQIENLTIVQSSEMYNLSRKINETFYDSHDDSLSLLTTLRNQSGTKETGESATILNAFFSSIDYIRKVFSLLDDLVPQIASAMKIPDYWWKGFLAIIGIVVFVLIVAGLLKANW